MRCNVEQQTAVSRSFAFGECVKVLHCFHGHEFEIGEIVCIVGKSDYDDAWLCRNAKGVEWYLHDEEGEVVNCAQLPATRINNSTND